MLTDLERAFVEQAAQVYGEAMVLTRYAADHPPLTAPEPCESCGTTVIAFRAPSGCVKPYSFARLLDGGRTVRMLAHSPARCVAARGAR